MPIEIIFILTCGALFSLCISNLNRLYFVFTMLFSVIFFEFAGIPVIVPRFIVAFTILVMFVEMLFLSRRNSRKLTMIGIKPMLLLLTISFSSALLNNVSVISFLLFLRLMFVYYLLFIVVLNIDLSAEDVYKLNTFICSLFVIQIIATIVKLFSIGMLEEYVGTITITSGSLNAIVPMFALSYLFSSYLFKKSKMTIVLMLGFVFMGIVGMKRVIIFLFPICIMLGLYLVSSKTIADAGGRRKQTLPEVLFSGCFAFALIYLIVIVNPTLNPEHKIGGTFDIGYILEYSDKYTTTDWSLGPREIRRKDAPKYLISLIRNKGMSHFLLGMGPGDVQPSALTGYVGNVMLTKYGIRYGGRTGFLRNFVEVGILGVFFYLILHIVIISRIYKMYMRSSSLNYTVIALGFLLSSVIFLFDFFAYSNCFFSFGCLLGTYFYVAGVLLRNDSRELLQYSMLPRTLRIRW